MSANPPYRTRETCRICAAKTLVTVFDLGAQPVAGIFPKDDSSPVHDRTYPLELVLCTACGLLQLRHSLSPALMYPEYAYRSGINQTMRDHLAGISRAASDLVSLRPGDTVLDIGCNDGTLLLSYPVEGLDRVGIDPAENITRFAKELGLAVLNDYFGRSSWEKIRPGKKARVVTSIAMFYDLEDPCGFARDVASILAPDGVWVVEMSYMPSMLRLSSFDTIVHEHLEYYALAQLEWIAREAGLVVHRVELNDSNGGSFRLFLRPKSAGEPRPEDLAAVKRMRTEEEALALRTTAPFEKFRAAAERVRRDLRAMLESAKREGKKVYAYGASTKGNTLLYYCGIDPSLVIAAADRNPDKWGARTPGTRIPIVSEDEARAAKPDIFLVLPWHFFEEMRKREAEFLRGGGAFLLPLPEARLVRE